MDMRIEKLFRVLVIGGASLAGCAPVGEPDHGRRGDPEVVADAGRDAGAIAEPDAGAADEDAGVDSWLSWT